VDVLISVVSRVGGRERNEDACGYWRDGGPVCCVLSDGAGGHGGGDVASRIAVETVLDGFASHPECSSGNLASLISRANREVMQEQSRSDRLRDMRATLVVLAFDPRGGLALWGHVGDSRLYMLRNGYVQTRTKDHSLLQSMIDAGFVDPADTAHHRDRSVLIASLGSDDGFEPDVLGEPIVMEQGDAFLLCSDGFWEHTGDTAIEAALQRATSPDDWLERLERRVIGARKPAQDNYSAIAVWCGSMDFTTRTLLPD
jgi:serine/threonine protein phosphatase PrpC